MFVTLIATATASNGIVPFSVLDARSSAALQPAGRGLASAADGLPASSGSPGSRAGSSAAPEGHAAARGTDARSGSSGNVG